MRFGKVKFQDREINRLGAIGDLTTEIAPIDGFQLLARLNSGGGTGGVGVPYVGSTNELSFGSTIRILSTTLSLTFAASASLRGTWTFPAGSFSAPPRCWAMLSDGMVGATPTLQHVGSIAVFSKSASSVLFQLTRISGLTNFVSGDTVSIDAFAWGKP
jgi:hypothetical protein